MTPAVPMIAGSQSPETLITSTLDAPPPSLVYYRCLNGPCQWTPVEAPSDATPGTACAVRWTNAQGKPRYAVYMLVDHNGSQGLMFIQSYTHPQFAQAKVQRLTAICAADIA